MTEQGFEQYGGVPAETALKALCDGVADLLRLTPHPPGRLSVRLGAAAVDLEWPSGQAVQAVPAAAPADVLAEAQHQVMSPLVGTFYRSPQPGARPFVEIGDVVQAGQQVAVLEAMKLLHPVEADRPGRITAILVENAESVEYGQPLLQIETGDADV